ncbi:MAG: hypothetical protein H6683_06950 [Deltaproteobacteria bacterium]|nr:hypothetical protein [Deltaproteobacteria bacterium]
MARSRKEKYQIALSVAVAVVIVANLILLGVHLISRAAKRHVRETVAKAQQHFEQNPEAVRVLQKAADGALSPRDLDDLLAPGFEEITGDGPSIVSESHFDVIAVNTGSRARAAILAKHERDVESMYRSEMATYHTMKATEFGAALEDSGTKPGDDSADLAARLLAEERSREIPGVLRGNLEFDPAATNGTDAPPSPTGPSVAGAAPTPDPDEPVRENIRVPYAAGLGVLMMEDEALADDPQVTFIFGAANTEGFTFTTKHAQGERTFIFTTTRSGF